LDDNLARKNEAEDVLEGKEKVRIKKYQEKIAH